jgi:hypothetical protein
LSLVRIFLLASALEWKHIDEISPDDKKTPICASEAMKPESDAKTSVDASELFAVESIATMSDMSRSFTILIEPPHVHLPVGPWPHYTIGFTNGNGEAVLWLRMVRFSIAQWHCRVHGKGFAVNGYGINTQALLWPPYGPVVMQFLIVWRHCAVRITINNDLSGEFALGSDLRDLRLFIVSLGGTQFTIL